MSAITIYNASAGSGKTYTLTKEYVSLLFSNTNNYKNILAVTFTNKAAEEMKTRILKELYLLASNPAKADHYNYLSSKYKLNPEQVQARAKLVLNNILHDYSNFSVSTIDSFFQLIIRAFAKEIGLQTGFVLELDTNESLEKAVDLLIKKLDDNKFLRSWLIQFSESRIKDQKTWNFRDDIIKLGREIFKESFADNQKYLLEKQNDSEFFVRLKSQIRKLVSDIESKAKQLGIDAVNKIQNAGLDIDDFPYKKSGFASIFYKFAEGGFASVNIGSRVNNAIDNIEKWSAKSSKKKAEIEAFYHTGGNLLLNEIVDFYNTNIPIYNTAVEVLSFIDSLAIITNIYTNIHELLKQENKFLLAFAGTFIKEIIEDSDAPFLYEKTGNRYKFFMIDEFQDTSAIQWANFEPLIRESIANNNSSIIVGDVKQSIYRWRNGDWKLLSTGVEQAFKQFKVERIPLTQNWRSKKNIIEFNNVFFKKAVDVLETNILETNSEAPDEIKSMVSEAYKDIEQEYPEVKNDSNEGYVRIELPEVDDEKTDKEIAFENIPKWLERLQDAGYSMRDVCILVRSNTEGSEIVEYINRYAKSEEASEKYNYNIISNEALILGKSPVLNLIMAVLNDIFDGENLINTAYLKYEYYLQSEQKNIEKHLLFSNKQNNLPEQYIKQKNELKNKTLYEITEEIIDIFGLNKQSENLIYLQAFKDKILEYSSNNTADYFSFVEWWEKYGKNSSVKINEEQDAVKVISIHKSKGLEFETVILPFATWEFKNNNATTVLWTEIDTEPFNQLKLLPVKFKSVLKNSLLAKQYYEENIQIKLDNLNLLYVAFTRAKTNLIAFTKQKQIKKNEIKEINNTALLINEILGLNEENPLFEKGELAMKTSKPEIAKMQTINTYVSSKINADIKIKFKSDSYSKQRKKGLLYHKIFENIVRFDDIKKATMQIYKDGLIDYQEIEEIAGEVKNSIEKAGVKHWFTDDYKVRNELSILQNSEIKRPDRVMIKDDEVIIVDYKFGDKKDNKYHKQIKEYASLYKNLGYSNIKTYIWYVMLNTLEKVE